MNQWLVAAIVLGAGLLPCLAVCSLAGPLSGLAALEVGSALTSTVLVLLAEGIHREPFVDLALVFACLSLVGAIAFARLMEHDL
jgi:multisubunit Na+/H+ antiporter MnhF subunit